MGYPNFDNKHLEEALFSPKDFVKYRKIKLDLPKKYIITYQSRVEKYFVRKYKPKKIMIYSLLTIWVYKDIGLVRMTGIGSPNAAVIMEELIALGGRKFLNIGTAGGLNHEGIYLCEKAIRDEGTSYHYLEGGEFVYPDPKLTEKLAASFERNKIAYLRGTTWTIDAPYRETKAEVEHYLKKGVSTVEMEASAVFAVANYRKVSIAAAFVVSDLLGKKWLPKFHRFDVRKAQKKLVDIAVDCFRN